jgi:hypothetical protein
LLFIFGWVFIIAYAFSPLWQGKRLLKFSALASVGAPITDFSGGSDFAFRQKSKQGDVPRVLALNDLPTAEFLIVLIWNYDLRIDNRWTPLLLQYDGRQFLYASGEQTPSRIGYAGGKRVPSTHVMRLAWSGSLDERVYALQNDTRYFLLLPQNSTLSADSYSIELRSRKSGAEQPTRFLLFGFFALLGGILILGKHSRASREPVTDAYAYARWKRFAQARQVLKHAIKQQPERRLEFEIALREVEALEKRGKSK